MVQANTRLKVATYLDGRVVGGMVLSARYLSVVVAMPRKSIQRDLTLAITAPWAPTSTIALIALYPQALAARIII